MTRTEFQNEILSMLLQLQSQLNHFEDLLKDRDEMLIRRVNSWLDEQRQTWLKNLREMILEGEDDDPADAWKKSDTPIE